MVLTNPAWPYCCGWWPIILSENSPSTCVSCPVQTSCIQSVSSLSCKSHLASECVKKWLHCFLAHIWFCLWETATAAEQKNTFALGHRAAVWYLPSWIDFKTLSALFATNKQLVMLYACCTKLKLTPRPLQCSQGGTCFHTTLNMQSHASLTAYGYCLSDLIPGDPQSCVGAITPVLELLTGDQITKYTFWL